MIFVMVYLVLLLIGQIGLYLLILKRFLPALMAVLTVGEQQRDLLQDHIRAEQTQAEAFRGSKLGVGREVLRRHLEDRLARKV